ncbi:MAG: hypothetical protein KKD74_01110 [Bacteroidetes bacterium]|nr:hypothetical protein [Bacteroidota bacterium]
MENQRIHYYSWIVCVILLIALTSCRKKPHDVLPYVNQYDTIKPLAYFPVYPGSWWKYENYSHQLVTDSVSIAYVLHYYNIAYDGSHPENSDSTYVPLLHGEPVYGYHKIECMRPPFGQQCTKWPIISEQIGFSFPRGWSDTRYGDFMEHVVVKQKTFNGQDSVLILEGHWVYGPNTAQKRRQEFVKGIGLAYDIVTDTLTQDTLYQRKLIDYFVNFNQ